MIDDPKLIDVPAKCVAWESKVERVDDDDEHIWETMCETIARRLGVSAAQVKAVLEDAGFHAYGHDGIVEAFEVVQHAVRSK